MARRPKAVVLDSWAVMAYLDDERAGSEVAKVIADSHERGTPLLMTTVNAGEVWYILAREISETDAERAITDLRQLGIRFVDADWSLVRVAASFKARHRMSYADCFAAALAKDQKADLLTGDKEFQQVQNEVRVSWL